MAISPMRSGKHRVQVYDPATGNMRHVGVFAELSRARRAERLALLRSGTAAGETVAEFESRWLEDYPRSESTNLHNRQMVKWFVRRHGRLRMDLVTRRIMGVHLRDRPQDRSALSAMFGDAVGEGLIDFNPCSHIKLRGKQKRGRKNLPAGWFTIKDVHTLARAAVEIDPHWGRVPAALMIVAAETGMRPGELFGLSWPDIDWKRRRITIHRAMNSKTRKLDTPKNGRPRRIGLSRAAARALRTVIEFHPEIVFPTPNARRFYGNSWTYHFKPIRAAVGRPRLTLHEFRHLHGTRLREAAARLAELSGQNEAELPDWQIALTLGHEDGGELVRTTYTHPEQELAIKHVLRLLDRLEEEPGLGEHSGRFDDDAEAHAVQGHLRVVA